MFLNGGTLLPRPSSTVKCPCPFNMNQYVKPENINQVVKCTHKLVKTSPKREELQR